LINILFQDIFGKVDALKGQFQEENERINKQFKENQVKLYFLFNIYNFILFYWGRGGGVQKQWIFWIFLFKKVLNVQLK